MLKKFLIALSIILILGAGYFAYDQWKEGQELSVWSFIPETTLLVYESNQAAATYQYLSEQNSWNTLSLIREVNQINQTISSLDSILNQPFGLVNALENTSLLVSMHRIGRNQFDFMVTAELKQIANRNMLSKIQESFLANGYRKRQRDFLGENIIEIIDQGKTAYSYAIFKQYFIGSTTPYLVEDAIRLMLNSNYKNFLDQNPTLRTLIKLKQDQGNIYLNYAALPSTFEDIFPGIAIKPLGNSGFLDLKIEDQSISLDGFSFSQENQWLNTVDRGSGQPMGITEVIPINAAIIQHYGFTSREIWGAKHTRFLEINEPEAITTRKELLSSLDMDVSYSYQLLEDEIAMVNSYSSGETHHLLLMEIAETDLMKKHLEGVIERYINKTGDTVLNEQYKSYQIQALPTSKYAYAFFGSPAKNFKDCFFTYYRNYLIISDHLPYLKQTLDDIENENTWRKSLRKSNFLEQVNQEAGYSLFVNVPAALRNLSKGLSKKWQPIVSDNDYVLQSFENVAVQFTLVDQKYYTNILFDQPDGALVSEVNPIELKSINLGSKIISKPYLVPDHAQTQNALMVQDSTLELYWIAPDFEVSWSKKLDGIIQGKVLTLDYYKNKKIQYAFITSARVHLMDREGNYLPGFPKTVKGADSLRHLSIVDYDGSKDYRLAVSDRKGNVFLTDKEVIPLQGWRPKSFNGTLAADPQHYRISNKDLFLIPLQEGNIHVINRRSNSYTGFPVATNEFISGDVFFNPASSFNSSNLTVVTKNGNLQSFDLQGKVKDFSQLYKPEPETAFRLIKDVKGQSFLIERKTENRIDFLNSNLELLFGKDYLDEDQLFVQYYNINPSKQYVVIGNFNGQFVYIYDLSGRLITSRPLIGNQPVSLMYYEKSDEEMIYIVNNSNLSLFSLKK